MGLYRILIFPLLYFGTAVFSQQKTLAAYKVDQPPRIDGNLDDPAWTNASVATDFIQNFPNYGLPASVKSDVKIVYDNTAIYVGAYMHDNPSQIRKQITARDEEQFSDVDYFSVFLDTYDDKQNGFEFLVTSMNVQTDARLGANLGGSFGSFGDKTWDAVWDSKVSMKPDGWVVEMKIPYISLRFSKKDVQDWGLQFLRFTRRNNEMSFWNPVDPQVNGFVNQFGKYVGLKNIEPPLRLSFSPYLSGGIRFSPDKNGARTEWLRNGGMDVKYGINESFTLDATLIPDFGQVVSDNVINNLTPYEIRFQENRPFFTEGTELFNKAGLFYSRRVGATPSQYLTVRDSVNNSPNLEIVKNPTLTQLYNAIKFSGRTRKKLGIGIFNAVTAPMHAVIRNRTTNGDTTIETEPLANYNIIVLDQSLKGRSYITFTNTNVIRNGNARDANVSAVDFNFYDKRNIYSLKGLARYSKIFGINPYDGYNAALFFAKVSGNVQYQLGTNVESARYDPNDLGYLPAPNGINYSGVISYTQFNPTKNFLTYSYRIGVNYNWLYNPNVYSNLVVKPSALWVFKNFWDVTISAELYPSRQNDFFELRTPGRFLKRPSYYYVTLNGSTDSRKRLFFRYNVGYSRSTLDTSDYYNFDLGARYRFSDKFSLDLDVARQHDLAQLGYAFIRESNGDPIVGIRKYTDVASVLTGIYNFTPRLNLTLRARHYWSRVIYKDFYNVKPDGNFTRRAFINGQDQNFNIFNLDAFLTWDFRLGSRFILGYKNWLDDNALLDGTRFYSYTLNAKEIFNFRHGNELTLRFIYFLDYNQLKKKNLRK
jgi:hypothetical protein